MSTANKVRKPKHAGVFYPADKQVLEQQIAHYLSNACEPVKAPVKAIIAPHAGYDFSGQVAGMAYAALQAQSDISSIQRIVILAPNHQTAIKGALVSSHNSWQTPLGEVEVDQDFIAKHWQDLSQVNVDDEVCQAEYSVEVQLPFIQRVLLDIPIVPILLGNCEPEQMIEILRPAWESDDTLIIISSDLYHYLPREKAVPTGIDIARMIEQHDYNKMTTEMACGYVALRGVMELAEADSYYWRTLGVRHSGQNNRFNLTKFVGYGAFALMKKLDACQSEAGQPNSQARLNYTLNNIGNSTAHPLDIINTELANKGYYLANNGEVCTSTELTVIADHFGGIWQNRGVQAIAPTDKPQFIAQTTEAIPPHNECAYAMQPPRYLLLHCRENEVSGGDFYLLDGSAVAKRFSASTLNLLYHSPFQCLIDANNPQQLTVLKQNQYGFYLQYSCIGHDAYWASNSNYLPVAPFYQGYESIIATLQAQLRREDLREYHSWKAGDLLIIDNQRFLHGRDAFDGVSRRLDHIRIG